MFPPRGTMGAVLAVLWAGRSQLHEDSCRPRGSFSSMCCPHFAPINDDGKRGDGCAAQPVPELPCATCARSHTTVGRIGWHMWRNRPPVSPKITAVADRMLQHSWSAWDACWPPHVFSTCTPCRQVLLGSMAIHLQLFLHYTAEPRLLKAPRATI